MGWLPLGLKFAETEPSYDKMWKLNEQLQTPLQVLKFITKAHQVVSSVVTITEGANVIQRHNACAVWALFMTYLGEIYNGEWLLRVSMKSGDVAYIPAADLLRTRLGVNKCVRTQMAPDVCVCAGRRDKASSKHSNGKTFHV